MPFFSHQPENERLYPRLLVFLLGINPVGGLLLSIFYLFGGFAPTAESKVASFFLFVGFQLLWLLPCLSFFVGLDLWGRGRRTRSVLVGISGFVTLCFATYYVLQQW